ncbi:serine hydrolase domain-containing protein [Actinomadura miaoliensis]|uniref:Serine hydrolase n=1 Tax=Actinomadura miaoliensis TaxID=430685 RepID=A0ABP7X5S7_9ACTN
MKIAFRRAALGALLAAVLTGLTAPSAVAEPTPAAQPDLRDVGSLVDRVVPAQLAEDKIPGAAVVVVAGGKAVFAKGYGVADVDARTPVDPDRTAFFTGSLAKPFTATAVLQLVRQGKLDLNADVNRYLTTFKIKDTYPGRPVTLRHLLTYTGGFDDDIVGLGEADPKDVGSLGRSLAERQPRRVRPPGTRVAYDNYGIALAGYLVEVVSGQPFAEYVRQHVFEPLGMRSTTMAVPHPAAIDSALAAGYRPSGDGYTRVKGQYGPRTPTGTGPAATPADMGRFMLAQLGNDPRLGQDVARLMQQQHYTQDRRMPGMGYTFEQRPRNGRRLLYKDGDVPGFHNVMALLPDQGVGVYVVYNGDGVDTVAGWDGASLVNQIVDRYLPATARTVSTSGGTVTGSPVSKYAGTYRSARVSHTTLTKVTSLFSAVTVTAGPGGTLTTTGLSVDPEKETQHWVQTQPGLFTERGGQARIAFDGKGTLTSSANPSEALEKLAWYDSPGLNVGLLGGASLVMLLAFVGFPVLALVRVLRRRSRHPAGARAARLLAWATTAVVTVFLTGLAVTMADPNAVMETVALNPPAFAALPIVATVGLVLAILVVGATGAAWWKAWWSWAGRLSCTLLALSGVVFFKVLMTYNLVALPFPTN